MDKIDVHDQFPVEELNVDFFDPCGGSTFGGIQNIPEDNLCSGSAEGEGATVEKKGEGVSISPDGGFSSSAVGVKKEVPDRSVKSVPVSSREKSVSVRKAEREPVKKGVQKVMRAVDSAGSSASSDDAVRLTLCLDSELVEGLRLLSRVKGRTMSSLVVSALVGGLCDDSAVDEEKSNFKRMVNGFLMRYGK